MKSSAYLRESHSQRLGAAEEQEPEHQLGGCSSLSRLWAPCAGWRQALVFHMSLPLPVLKCPGALCFPGPRVGSVTQELATPAVLAGTEGQDHGVWNVLYIFPDQDCSDLLPLSPSFVLDKKKKSCRLTSIRAAVGARTGIYHFGLNRSSRGKDIEKAAKRVPGMVPPFNS